MSGSGNNAGNEGQSMMDKAKDTLGMSMSLAPSPLPRSQMLTCPATQTNRRVHTGPTSQDTLRPEQVVDESIMDAEGCSFSIAAGRWIPNPMICAIVS